MEAFCGLYISAGECGGVAAGRWYAGGVIRVPEDQRKVSDALELLGVRRLIRCCMALNGVA